MICTTSNQVRPVTDSLIDSSEVVAKSCCAQSSLQSSHATYAGMDEYNLVSNEQQFA